MTASVPRGADSWTFDDLHDLPEDGKRYELIDGRLLGSPMPAKPHYRVLTLLHELLVGQCPKRFAVGQNGGILDGPRRNTYLIPDLMVTPRSVLKGGEAAFTPPEAVLVVEVLSPSSRKNDNVIKRRYYARMGIPHYWIVDPEIRTLHVMRLEADPHRYLDVATIQAGNEWHTAEPFPITLDPAEFC